MIVISDVMIGSRFLKALLHHQEVKQLRQDLERVNPGAATGGAQTSGPYKQDSETQGPSREVPKQLSTFSVRQTAQSVISSRKIHLPISWYCNLIVPSEIRSNEPLERCCASAQGGPTI